MACDPVRSKEWERENDFRKQANHQSSPGWQHSGTDLVYRLVVHPGVRQSYRVADPLFTHHLAVLPGTRRPIISSQHPTLKGATYPECGWIIRLPDVFL
jgi:hypothetical protein